MDYILCEHLRISMLHTAYFTEKMGRDLRFHPLLLWNDYTINMLPHQTAGIFTLQQKIETNYKSLTKILRSLIMFLYENMVLMSHLADPHIALKFQSLE